MTPRESIIAGGRAVLSMLDARDQQAELDRARREGEVVRGPRPPRPPGPPPSPGEQVRQLWRWAAWVYPDGIPPGWTAAERPEGM